MAYKFYGEEWFYAEIEGKEYRFRCQSQQTRYGFRHVCDFTTDLYDWKRVKCCYYNRTWESFKYESALRKAIDKCPAEHQEALKAELIEKRIKEEREKAEAFIDSFKKEYEKASPGIKEALQGTTVQSEEEAQRVLAIVKMHNIITGK